MLSRDTTAFNENFNELLFCDKKILIGLAGQGALLWFFQDGSFSFLLSLMSCGVWQFASAETYAKRFIYKNRHDRQLEELVKAYNILKLDERNLSSQHFSDVYMAISRFVPRSMLTHVPTAPLPLQSQSYWTLFKGKASGFVSYAYSYIKKPSTETQSVPLPLDKGAASPHSIMDMYCTYVCGYGTQISLAEFFKNVMSTCASALLGLLTKPRAS